jgi:hypothetical protein
MIAALWRVRSCDSRRLPISGPIGKKLQWGCAGPLRCSAADFAAFAAKRLNDARAWLAKAMTGKRASHPSRQDRQRADMASSKLPLAQGWNCRSRSGRNCYEVVAAWAPVRRAQAAASKSGDWRTVSRPTRPPGALQQIEDPARRTRSAAQRRRGSRLVGIRSRSARSTNVHANHSQPIANHSRSSVRSRHYRREGNSKRAVRRAQKRPPGRR